MFFFTNFHYCYDVEFYGRSENSKAGKQPTLNKFIRNKTYVISKFKRYIFKKPARVNKNIQKYQIVRRYFQKIEIAPEKLTLKVKISKQAKCTLRVHFVDIIIPRTRLLFRIVYCLSTRQPVPSTIRLLQRPPILSCYKVAKDNRCYAGFPH